MARQPRGAPAATTTAGADRFRRLFTHLDDRRAWAHVLPPAALAAVRAAAADPAAWRAFLAGPPPSLSSPVEPVGAAAPAPAHNLPSSQLHADRALPGSPGDGTPPGDGTTPTGDRPPPGGGGSGSGEIAGEGMRAKTGEACGAVSPALSASMRRRLAIASVHAQFFPAGGASVSAEGAGCEPDVGMLAGDDGGYTDFAELQREEEAARRSGTAIYTLLGDDGEVDGKVAEEEARARGGGTPKRPRRGNALGLAERMEEFIRDLRVLCEPCRDAAQEESKLGRDVPQNTHRKAVSAASVVEELKEIEHKVRIGKIDRVEECISAASACIGTQDQTFADVLSQIDGKADKLREEQQLSKDRFMAIERVRALTTGVLGYRPMTSEDSNESWDEEMTDAAAATQEANTAESWVHHNSDESLPFSEADLAVWPSRTQQPSREACTVSPRVPTFQQSVRLDVIGTQNNDRSSPTKNASDSLVGILGEHHSIVKTIRSVSRIRHLRRLAFDNLTLLREVRAAHNARLVAIKQRQAKLTISNQAKTENLLPLVPAESDAAKPSTVHDSRVPKTEDVLGPPPSQKPPMPEYAITNDSHDRKRKVGGYNAQQESRERVLAKAVCGLMCAHGGFTHVSSCALEVLADLLADFIERIGRILGTYRENIECLGTGHARPEEGPRSVSRDQIFEAFRLITSAGFRGSFPELAFYAERDVSRSEQAARETEARMRAQVARIQLEVSNSGGKPIPVGSDLETSQGHIAGVKAGAEGDLVISANKDVSMTGDIAGHVVEVVLDDAAFLYGHFENNVSLDVLGGIKVPRKLGVTGPLPDAMITAQQPQGDGSSVPAQIENTNSTVKMENVEQAVSVMDA